MLRQFRLSHACIVSKRLSRSLKFFHHLDRRIILVFRHQGSLRISDGFIPKGGVEYEGSTNMRLYLANGNRYIFTIKNEYEIVCALSSSAAFDDLE